MPNGYTGNILRVDLSNQTTSMENLDEKFYRRYYGGMGFTSYFLLKELKPGIDPLGPENKLIFSLGVASGVSIPGVARNGIGAKSPMSNGFGKSEVGGYWGAELKRAGYDAIIVEGKAEKPVYLWLHDGKVDIRDAVNIWGKGAKEAHEGILSDLGDKSAKVAIIGPGGEHMVRYACINNDLKHTAGRTGMGAVMGSKNLKAIAVRGHETPQVASPENTRALAKWMADNYKLLAKDLHENGTGNNMVFFNTIGNLPVRNFRDGDFSDAGLISAEVLKETIRIGMEGCFACSIRCKKVVSLEEPYKVDPAYGGPEYETLASLGSNCGVNDLKAISRGNHLCEHYTLDTISTGGTIAFAMECFENGILTIKDTDGIELAFGNSDAMLQIIDKIGRREGIGNILAEGSLRAAKTIGGAAEKFAMQVKGLEFGMHEPRLAQGLGLGYTIAPHGADHIIGIHDILYQYDTPQKANANTLGQLDTIPSNQLSPKKAAFFRDVNCWTMFQDCMLICIFVPYNYEQTIDIVKAVTGWNCSLLEAMRVGERAINLARIFNYREGFTSADDRLPERFFSPPRTGSLKEQNISVDALDMENARRSYYRLMGWNDETGESTRAKLEELGIGWAMEYVSKD